MNTEPPTGDDLEQMLVAMKRTVLTRAVEQRPQPRRRGRRAGIVIGVIAVLGIGATSGGVALGMIPQPFTAAPAPAPTPTEPADTPTRSSAPVVNEPTSTPTPTPTRRPFALDDPSTWTISGDEFGPVALGGQFAAETDDLGAGSTRAPIDDECPAPGYGAFVLNDSVTVEVLSDLQGVVQYVRLVNTTTDITPPGPSRPRPTTADGLGAGSTLDDFRARYADVHPRESGQTGPWSVWQVATPSGPISLETGPDGTTVYGLAIGDQSKLPQTICD